MNTMFDPSVRDELLHRIGALDTGRKALWGKMDVLQMVKHCTLWSEWVSGKGPFTNYVYKQDLLGKIFGKWALRSNTKDDKPIGKGMPAGKLAIKDKVSGDLQTEKDRWIQCIADYERFSNDGFVHDFFGRMTREQIGIFAYKHFDHHLRQFGV